MAYLLVVEPTRTGFSVYAPDLPGCVAAGGTRREALRNMEQAIEMHLEGLDEDGTAPPTARASAYQWDRRTGRARRASTPRPPRKPAS
jgi:predicted RNase H-like HicB family nuclease